jgi:glutamyl/glutaminyl-tRNA synthetase
MDPSAPDLERRLPPERPAAREVLAGAMQRVGLLETPVPAAAERWIETFLDAFTDRLPSLHAALEEVGALRAEAVFVLDAVAQYVDDQPELRALPLERDLPAIADEFGIAHADALAAVRMALTGTAEGPPLALLFPLLGHERIMIRIGAVSSHILHGRGLEPIRFGPGGTPFETIHGARPPATGDPARES